MKNPNNHPTNFWFGFAVGSINTATVAYLLGTKHGREILKKLIQYAENIEEHQSPMLLERFKEVMGTITNEGENNSTESSMPPQNIENVMEKIKNVAQPKKYIKKFFAKSGEIINK